MIDQPFGQAPPITPPAKRRRVGILVSSEGLPEPEATEEEILDKSRKAFASRSRKDTDKYGSTQTYTEESPFHKIQPDPNRLDGMITMTPSHTPMSEVDRITLESKGQVPQKVRIRFFAPVTTPQRRPLSAVKCVQVGASLPSVQSATKESQITFPKGKIAESKKILSRLPPRPYLQSDIMNGISAGAAAQRAVECTDWEHLSPGRALAMRLCDFIEPKVTRMDLGAGDSGHNRSTAARAMNIVSRLSDETALKLSSQLELIEDPSYQGHYAHVGYRLTDVVTYVSDSEKDDPVEKTLEFMSYVFGSQIFRGTKGKALKDEILKLADPASPNLVSTHDEEKEDDKENADQNAGHLAEGVRNDSFPSF